MKEGVWKRPEAWLILLCVLLLAPALLINLGLMTFIDDEAIRSLVAMEMVFSGNYIVPTLNGELYFNKPPLYNWYLLIFFNVFGNFSEFSARFATVISLLGYSATIYYFFQKHYGKKYAFLLAMLFITCGRVLLWDSHLGLIDITFSWVTFSSFMVVYHQFERRNWYALFLITYLLTAAGFLMKGLPSVVFQGLTLLAWFTYNRSFRKLFTLPHLLGGLLFLSILGLYYYLYSRYVPVEEVSKTLLVESSKRTAVNYGVWPTIRHFFTFPFEMIYHFLPWSLFILFVFWKKCRYAIWNDRFLFFNALIFLVNIILYWTSVEVYPRYLLMHAPLIFAVFLHWYMQMRREPDWGLHAMHILWGLMLGLMLLGAATPFWWERAQQVSFHMGKGAFLVILLAGLTYSFWRMPRERLLVMVAAMLVLRIGFNWFVLPDRHSEDWGTEVKISSIEMGRSLREIPEVFVYKNTYLPITNAYYLTREYGKIIPHRDSGLRPGDVVIIDHGSFGEVPVDSIGLVKMRYRKQELVVGRLK